MRKPQRNLVPLVVAAAGIMLIAAAMYGQTSRPTWQVELGLFPTSFSSNARLDSETNPGDEVDMENDLGLDNNLSNARLDATWRFKPRHRMEFGFTSWKRSADKEIQRDIHWGDAVYPLGVTLSAENKANFLKVGYRYSLYQTDTTEIDVAVAVDALKNTTTLRGEATITNPDGTQTTGEREVSKDFTVPVPVVGFAADHRMGKTVLRGSAEFLKITYNDWTGKVLDAKAAVDYLFSQSWGAGIGYNYVGMKIERTNFDAKYDFSGPIVYFSWRK